MKSIEVDRFDIKNTPRSFALKFTFAPNEWFEDEVLEKKFYFRRSSDNIVGLVSEPVKINWKKGKDKDLSQGLTDAAIKYWEAKQKHSKVANGSGKTAKLPEQQALLDLIEKADSASRFFTMFSYVPERRYVTAEESEKANAAEKERRAKAKAGEEVEEIEEDQIEFDDLEAEACPHGADLATMIAEDIWPNAIKYFSKSRQIKVLPDFTLIRPSTSTRSRRRGAV